MFGNIVAFLVGITCIVLGISNMRGNISSLHKQVMQWVIDLRRVLSS